MKALAGLLALLPLAAFGATETRTMKLAETLAFAVEHAPAMDAARRSAEIGELEKKNATAALLPSLDVSATHGVQDDIPSSATNLWTSALTVALTENFYDNGESLTRNRIAGFNREISRLRFLEARESLSLDVAQEFHNYSLARGLIDVRREQHRLLVKQFESMSNQYRQGLKTRDDFVRMKAQLLRSELDVMEAENAIIRSQTALRRLIGADPASDAVGFEPLVARKEAPMQPAGSPMIESGPAWRTAAYQREVSALNTELVRRRWWPQLTLTGALNYGATGYLNSGTRFTDTDSLNWNAVLGVRYNIWDWGTRRRDTEVAEHREGIDNDRVADDLLRIRAEATQLMARLAQSRAAFTMNAELVDIEERSFAALEDNYRRGRISYLDLITGLGDLSRARVSLTTSYFALAQGLAQHRYLEGKLYVSLTTP